MADVDLEAEAQAEPARVPISEKDEPKGHSIFDNNAILSSLIPFFAFKELKKCRLITPNLDAQIRKSPFFLRKCKAHVRDSWYETASRLQNFIVGKTPTPVAVEMTHFGFRRHVSLFKDYWHTAADRLTTLNISHCSFECDGFSYLLDHAPALETLVLDDVKLRDLDDFHTTGIPRGGAPGPAPTSARTSIRHLAFRNMFKMEQCFMSAIIGRSAGLESIELTKCFMNADKRLTGNDRPTFKHMYMEFLGNLLQLFRRNKGTLRKYVFRSNQYQEHLLGSLGQLMAGRVIPELELILVDEDYGGVMELMNSPSEVHSLRLEFLGRLNNAQLQGTLRGVAASLRRLDFTFQGDQAMEQLDMSWLNQFQRLESLKISDTKPLNFSEMRRLVGGRRQARVGLWRRRRFGWGRRNTAHVNVSTLIARVTTNMTHTFLSNLPPLVRKLAVNHFISPANFLLIPVEENLRNLYRQMTKLVVHGPWIHSLDTVLPVIVREVQQLRSLSLADTGLTDAIMTGLSTEAANDAGRCLTYGLVLFVPGAIPSAEAVIQAVEQNLAPHRVVQGYQGLSDLPHLEHLDLSTNPGITGLSLFYGLRIPGLKTLSLNGCPRILDSSLCFLSLFCPNLIELNLKNCRKVSQLGLNMIVKKCPKLRRLYTTPFIKNQAIPGIHFALSPDYDSVVVTTPQSKIQTPGLEVYEGEEEEPEEPEEEAEDQ